jgi:hypothetical protein
MAGIKKQKYRRKRKNEKECMNKIKIDQRRVKKSEKGRKKAM